MLAQERELDNDLMERTNLYGIRRRPDRDYTNTVFRCPTNGRQYQSVRAPTVADDPAAPCVTAYCYWCDTYRRIRGLDHGFDRDRTQPHTYPIVEDEDAS